MLGRAAMIAVLLAPTASIARHDDHSTAMTPARRCAVECEKSSEYVLSVGGATGALPSFRVTATTPVEGSRLRGPVTQMTVDFNDSLLLTSLAASDLTVNGVPATGLTVLDYNTLRFNLPVLGDGTQNVAIAAGAIQDLQGTPVDAF